MADFARENLKAGMISCCPSIALKLSQVTKKFCVELFKFSNQFVLVFDVQMHVYFLFRL